MLHNLSDWIYQLYLGYTSVSSDNCIRWFRCAQLHVHQIKRDLHFDQRIQYTNLGENEQRLGWKKLLWNLHCMKMCVFRSRNTWHFVRWSNETVYIIGKALKCNQITHENKNRTWLFTDTQKNDDSSWICVCLRFENSQSKNQVQTNSDKVVSLKSWAI